MSCGVDVRTAQSRILAVDGILNRFANVSKLSTLLSSRTFEQSKKFFAFSSFFSYSSKVTL